jgi:iron-sulfur cluster assembly protein
MITVTKLASKKILANLARRGQGIGIRVGVRTTGCSGLAYVLEYVDETWSGSTSFRQDGFSIVVDNKDLPVVDNLEIDYVRQGLNEGFEFRNPLEKDRCGCGESFRI